ncbi:WD40 repeat protein [Spironucleus salmonicida]|uniref:Cilia- and flagella-associated protein 52 n=1 Tax=Spironucleus salmonicida TaxID=348837 RepID=V6LAZ7_9EUKA|nr:WD40 repeat protein [Spironucleus salmonicida]|eukprot:EST41403.1 WD40 domain-containing protein [Spironucleus salmonicida]
MDLLYQSALTINSQPLTLHPDALILAAGRNLISISTDSNQRIFPGHTKPISASTASPDGKFLASAQIGAVCIWDYETGVAKQITVPGYVKQLKFSQKSDFLGILLENGGFQVYDMNINKIGQFVSKEAEFIEFYSLSDAPRSSQFCVSADKNRLIIHEIKFDRASLQYLMSTDFIQVPASGIQRDFTCGVVSFPFVYLGTPAGEIAVFNIETQTFRGLLKYFKGKVSSIVILSEVCICATSYDGDIITLQGHDQEFLVASELSIDSNIIFAQNYNDQLIILTSSGTILSIQLETSNSNTFHHQKQTSENLNRFGNQGQLPAQSNYTSSLPHHRKFNEKTVEFENIQQTIFKLVSTSMIILHSFPQSPLTHSALLQTNSGEIIIGGTQTSLIQAWQNGILLAQIRLKSATKSLKVHENLIFTAQQSTLFCLSFDGEFHIQYEIPCGEITSVAVNEKYLAIGCLDGKIFVYQVENGRNIARFTEFSCAIQDMIFDNLIDQIIHVSVIDGYLVSYDVIKQKTLKSRSLGRAGRVFQMQQVDHGRHELVCGCLDNTVKFFDFDVNEAVQVAELPRNCLQNGKMFCGLNGDRIVAGGATMDGDEVLALMREGEEEWEAVDCQLANGVGIIGVLVGKNVYIIGDGGEIMAFEW